MPAPRPAGAGDEWGQDLTLDDWDPGAAYPDPEHDEDPGDGLSGLPEDVRAAALAQPWDGTGEAFAAGFLHHVRGGPAGQGFAAGGAMDLMPGGPRLAELVAAVTTGQGGHAALGESELIGVLCAWRRLASWAAAGEAAAVIILQARRLAQAAALHAPQLAEHVTDELAAALTLTGRAADDLASHAHQLGRLPAVHRALATGQIDNSKAAVFTRELAALPGPDATEVAAAALPDAPGATTGQLRHLLRRLILRRDPEAAETRRRDAARDAQVSLWTETSGNAALAGRELPEADALSADRRLTALARWLAARGTQGTVSQLRAKVFTALLCGHPVQSLLPPGMPATEGPDDLTRPGLPPVTGTIHLTMPISAWAGYTSNPGEIAGYGPVPATTCTTLAAVMASAAVTRWCLTLTNASGVPLAHACAGAGPGPPPGPAALAWATGLASRMATLETGPCDHSRREHRYRPSAALAHLIRIRRPHCDYPGCRRPAATCDLDHTTAYHRGGLTCECNLGPRCRHHHRAKQAPGWQLDQPTPGTQTWTLPHHRAYQTQPHRYPV